MGRAPCCDKANVKRGPWSPEEDAALRSYMERNVGTVGNWIALPHKAGLRRCGKSCRLRWLNYLRPDIKHGFFTQQEDDVIFTLYTTIGSRWSVIASHLPGRTDNDVKNYWNTKLKKKLLLCGGGGTQQTAASSLIISKPLPPIPPPLPTVKTEPCCFSAAAAVELINNNNQQQQYCFLPQEGEEDQELLPPFPLLMQSSSSSISAAGEDGSSTTADNWSAGHLYNYNINVGDGSGGDLFFSDFGSYSELLGGGFGDVAQGLHYQNATYS